MAQTKKMIDAQFSLEAEDMKKALKIGKNDWEAIVVNVKFVNDPENERIASEYRKAKAFINKFVPQLAEEETARRYVIKDGKVSLGEAVATEGIDYGGKAKPRRKKTVKNVTPSRG